MNLTQSTLAASLDVTPQTILMLEQGLFRSIPLSVAFYLKIEPEDYYDWIKEERERNSHYFDSPNLNQGWKSFRLSISASFRGFCRLLVFQPSILREFELRRQRNVQPLSLALIDVGLSDQSLRQLKLFTRSQLYQNQESIDAITANRTK